MNDNFILGFASPVRMKKVVNLHCGIYGNYYSLNLNTGGTRILLQLKSSRINLLALDLGTTKRTTVTIYPPECRLSNLQWRARNKPGIATVTSSFANPLRNRFENAKLRKYVEKTGCCRYCSGNSNTRWTTLLQKYEAWFRWDMLPESITRIHPRTSNTRMPSQPWGCRYIKVTAVHA